MTVFGVICGSICVRYLGNPAGLIVSAAIGYIAGTTLTFALYHWRQPSPPL